MENTEAEALRLKVEMNYLRLGYGRMGVPKPDATNKNFRDWKQAKLGLFYRPSDTEISYSRWMISHGQGNHWTVDEEEHLADEDFQGPKIGWEPCVFGYWFLADVAQTCPRINRSRDGLMGAIRLLSLEEYVIVCWTTRDLSGPFIDSDGTWCWLRTSFGAGALSAILFEGSLVISRHTASATAVPNRKGGGRIVVGEVALAVA